MLCLHSPLTASSVHRPAAVDVVCCQVRNTINEADGYQPHIIAPEAGYRRLIEDGLTLLRDPCEWKEGAVV